MAGTMQEVGNEPYVQMYSVKPYLSVDVLEQENVMYKSKSYHSGTQRLQNESSGTSQLASLERRQDDVLKRLEQLRGSVLKLKERYNVPDSYTSTTSSLCQTVRTTSSPASTGQGDLGNGLVDLVINADPSSVPYSLLVLCKQLSDSHRVLKSTFVHSNVLCTEVSDKLRSLFTSNGDLKRSDAQLAITLVWKKVANGPMLVVDPTQHTSILGEVNIARYLSRLLQPNLDQDDILRGTQIDDFLDMTQLQLAWGNSKEKAAALRNINASLGVQSQGRQGWLLAGPEPSTADIVVWSVLEQTGQASVTPPSNVKKWLTLCQQHPWFKSAVELLG